MVNLEDMLDDPEPLDEDDPESMGEVFAIHQYMGLKPEDLKGATEGEREQYAEWLRNNKEG